MISLTVVQTHAEKHLLHRLQNNVTLYNQIVGHINWQGYVRGIYFNCQMLEKEGWANSLPMIHRYIEDSARKFADMISGRVIDGLFHESIKQRDELKKLQTQKSQIMDPIGTRTEDVQS